MAFGFVVARFGLFLRLLAAERPGIVVSPESHHDVSNIVGITLVLVGIQHKSYVATLPTADIPRSHDPLYPVLLSALLALLGIGLAIYLAV